LEFRAWSEFALRLSEPLSARCCAANDAREGSDGVSCLEGLFELRVRKEPNMEIPPPCSEILSGVSIGFPTSHVGAALFSRRSRSSARCRSISGVSVRAGAALGSGSGAAKSAAVTSKGSGREELEGGEVAGRVGGATPGWVCL
jgi:hypothetical protein